MKEEYSKNKKGSLKKVWGQVTLMLAVLLLLTNCGTSKKAAEISAVNVPDIIESQESGIQLQDDCALIHIYRKSSMAGAAVSYDLYLDDDKIFRVKNKSKTTIKITKEGMITLLAKTETTTKLPIEIKLGNEYYIRCGIKMGALVGRPKIEVVDNQTGKAEFKKIP